MNRNTFNCLLISKRGYRKWRSWPNDWLPFTWKRPELKPGYFDTYDRVEGVKVLDPQLLVSQAKKDALAEFNARGKQLPDEIVRQFTIEFQKRKPAFDKTVKHQISKLTGGLDDTTLAGSIVRMTYRIRNSRQVLRQLPSDVRSKININWWAGKRMKRLVELYRFDRAEFDRLKDELQLDLPEFVLDGKMVEQIERKRELRRLTKEYCDKLKQDKLNAYHAKLKKQQIEFEQEKLETEQWIKEQMQQLNLRTNDFSKADSRTTAATSTSPQQAQS